MSATRFNHDRDGNPHRASPRSLLPCIFWEGIRELDRDQRRIVKQIARCRMRGNHFAMIAERVGLTVHQVCDLTQRLGIPTTTEFRRRRVLKLHRLGLSAPEVADRLGLTVRAVNILRQDLWLPPFPRIQRPVRHRSKIRAEVAAMLEAGHSPRVKDIAKTLGVSRQTVYAWIKAPGAPVEGGGLLMITYSRSGT